MDTTKKTGKLSQPGSKRLLAVWIYDILRQYSAKEQPMTQQMIIEKLQEKYQFDCRRSTLASYLHDFESEEFREIFGAQVRCDKRGGGYYLERNLSDGDLRLLIDGVMSLRSLSGSQTRELVEKLRQKGSAKFQTRVKGYTGTDIKGLPHSPNNRTLDNVMTINQAMLSGHQLSFIYNEFALAENKRVVLKPRREKRYVVNPYRLTISHSRIYLVGNTASHDNISTYRVDKMTEVLEENTHSKSWLELDKCYNPPKTLVESLYMFTGEAVAVEFWVTEGALRDVVDWFGEGYFQVYARKEGRLHIKTRCNEDAMLYWAMSYGNYVEVIKPQSLRQRIHDMAVEIATFSTKQDNHV
ncbi:MAG: WYL domain-containing protein [Selenomonadaceae bacterium]|nr:WYL domain-containing protein [Selenomonadaceae bacterium]